MQKDPSIGQGWKMSIWETGSGELDWRNWRVSSHRVYSGGSSDWSWGWLPGGLSLGDKTLSLLTKPEVHSLGILGNSDYHGPKPKSVPAITKHRCIFKALIEDVREEADWSLSHWDRQGPQRLGNSGLHAHSLGGGIQTDKIQCSHPGWTLE